MCASKITWQITIRDIAGKDNIWPALAFDELLKTASQSSLPYKDETRLGIPLADAWYCSQQVFRTFSLLETTNEKNILFAIHKLRKWCNLRTEAI